VVVAAALPCMAGSAVASPRTVRSAHWGVARVGIGRGASPTHPGKPTGDAPGVSSAHGCTVTLTSSVDGGLIVPTDQSFCLNGAHIHGGTRVQPGGEVTIRDSTIDGGLSSYGATSVWVCGSTVNGPTFVADGTGTVMIGADGDDGSALCADDALHGGVTVVWNLAGVEIGGDWITGPVTVIGNEGPAFSGSDVGAEVEGNHISGPVNCSLNSPAPTNDGLANTVSGPERGQCEGF
jgi:hexosaminidase